MLVQHHQRPHDPHVGEPDTLVGQRADRVTRAHLLSGDEGRAGAVANRDVVRRHSRQQVSADFPNAHLPVHEVRELREREAAHPLVSPVGRAEHDDDNAGERDEAEQHGDDAEENASQSIHGRC